MWLFFWYRVYLICYIYYYYYYSYFTNRIYIYIYCVQWYPFFSFCFSCFFFSWLPRFWFLLKNLCRFFFSHTHTYTCHFEDRERVETWLTHVRVGSVPYWRDTPERLMEWLPERSGRGWSSHPAVAHSTVQYSKAQHRSDRSSSTWLLRARQWMDLVSSPWFFFFLATPYVAPYQLPVVRYVGITNTNQPSRKEAVVRSTDDMTQE